MKKKVTFDRRGKIYLLGQDVEGTNYWLQEAKFDCEWYWGIGYVETYTNNRNPEKARDISSHQHFNGMFFNGKKNGFDNFKDFFVKTPFTDKEIWVILEIMKTLYTMREYSDTIYRGGSHYTKNPCSSTIIKPTEYLRINKIVIPELLRTLYKILGGEQE